MKTKEEVFNEHSFLAIGAISPSKDFCLKAMDEYAKQQAIEFMKFVDAFYSQNVSNESYDKMYNQFIESQNK
jgi:hypothetical protein